VREPTDCASPAVTTAARGARRVRYAIACADGIRARDVRVMLEFVYAARVDGLAAPADDGTRFQARHTPDQTLVDSAMRAAAAFELPDLTQWCDNVTRGDGFLNPSITTWLNEVAGQRAARLFVNKPKFADVVFDVDGVTCYGHRALLRVS
jgi:hypothetical protein